MHTMQRIGLSTLALALTLVLAGCGDKKEEKGATQVAARVNSEEITVHQLNFELAKLGNMSPEQSKKVANQVLKAMVDQQLLVQKAIEEKVDRDPQVLQALEAAKRQVLSQAYLQKISGTPAQPSDAEIADYYAKHPELFAERRIYRLQEVNVQVTAENQAQVKAQLAQSGNMNDFAQWLKAQNIPARAGQTVKPAEQLPMELLPKLSKMKDGQAITMAGAGSLNILILAGSQAQPLNEQQAKPVIERYLANAAKRKVAEAELEKLRAAGKVEYMGEYAEAGKEQAKPAEEAAAPAEAAPAPAPAGDQAIEKGLSGLK
ncbi:MAG: EpsD family peptidyl-prolyl cis-trans isomerase [Pseudomonadota bacterium]